MTGTPTRVQLLEDVAHSVPAAAATSWVRVAVDGVDGAGKSSFGDELAEVLKAAERPVIRASVDNFHRTAGGAPPPGPQLVGGLLARLVRLPQTV